MIELYTWGTPNGRKVSIMLEECGLGYNVHPVNIGKGEQFAPDYLKINPNGKIPSIVDPEGPGGKPIAMMESGAILIYLAEKVGKFHPARFKYEILQWLMFQMGHIGPMLGQAHHFMRNPKEVVPYAVERYGKEAKRLYGVMNSRLQENAFLAGSEYSIADIATFPWTARHEWHRVDLAEFPHVKRWFDAIAARPAVGRGMKVPFLN
jgi:GST-like protein